MEEVARDVKPKVVVVVVVVVVIIIKINVIDTVYLEWNSNALGLGPIATIC